MGKLPIAVSYRTHEYFRELKGGFVRDGWIVLVHFPFVPVAWNYSGPSDSYTIWNFVWGEDPDD